MEAEREGEKVGGRKKEGSEGRKEETRSGEARRAAAAGARIFASLEGVFARRCPAAASRDTGAARRGTY